MKKTEKSKINSLSYTWKILCWITISLIIFYYFYLGILSHNFYGFIQYLIISILISIFIYIFSYSIAEIIQLLEDIKNK